jgi:hypothetical protein
MTLARWLAVPLAVSLAACGPTLAMRYEAGNRALSTNEGAMYFVVISPILQRALNDCIPAHEPSPSPTLVFVADIDPAGQPLRVDVEPPSKGTDCMERELGGATFPKPPLAPGEKSFPVGLRIDEGVRS